MARYETIRKNDEDTEWLSVIRRNIETLRFGVVQVTIHDSKIVQVERTEKIRLDTQALNRKEAKK